MFFDNKEKILSKVSINFFIIASSILLLANLFLASFIFLSSREQKKILDNINTIAAGLDEKQAKQEKQINMIDSRMMILQSQFYRFYEPDNIKEGKN